MTPLDLTELADLMEDLRHSTGDTRIEQLQALHDLLDIADVVQGQKRVTASRTRWTGPAIH